MVELFNPNSENIEDKKIKITNNIRDCSLSLDEFMKANESDVGTLIWRFDNKTGIKPIFKGFMYKNDAEEIIEKIRKIPDGYAEFISGKNENEAKLEKFRIDLEIFVFNAFKMIKNPEEEFYFLQELKRRGEEELAKELKNLSAVTTSDNAMSDSEKTLFIQKKKEILNTMLNKIEETIISNHIHNNNFNYFYNGSQWDYLFSKYKYPFD